MSKKFHAFRVEYEGRVRELSTHVLIFISRNIDSRKNKQGKQFTAVWDTGANHTSITPNVSKALNLISSGKTEVRGVNSINEVNTYEIDIGLPNGVLVSDITVSENIIAGCDVLIGMDIIQMGDFAISNAGGKTTFSFCIPYHDKPIDLLERSLKINKRGKKNI